MTTENIIGTTYAEVAGSVNILLSDKGATYTSTVVAGDSGGIYTIHGGTNLTILGGEFHSYVLAGGFDGSIENGTQLIIEGGTFNEIITAGGSGGNGWRNNYSCTITANDAKNAVAMWVTGGTFKADVDVAGMSEFCQVTGDVEFVVDANSATDVVFEKKVWGLGALASLDGGVVMVLNGGTYEGTISAGNETAGSTINGGVDFYITDGVYKRFVEGTALSQVAGDVNLSITGGNFDDCLGIYVGGSLEAHTDATDLPALQGNTIVTIADGGLDGYAGVLDGGSVDQTAGYQRSLVITGGASDLSQATLSHFDKLRVVNKGTVTLAGNLDTNVPISVDSGTLILNNQNTVDSISLQNSGRLVVGGTSGSSSRALRAASSAEPHLTIANGGLTAGSGSIVQLDINVSTMDELVSIDPLITSTGAIRLNDGSTVALNNSGEITTADLDKFQVTLMTSTTSASVGTVTASLSDSLLNVLYDTTVELGNDGKSVVLVGTLKTDNPFLATPDPINARAGGKLLWEDRFELSDNPTLEEVFLTVLDEQNRGDLQAMEQTLAAAAGSTINSTGTAQHDALRDQIGTIRNRALSMSSDPHSLGHHFWIEGSGSYSHLRTQSDKGGYKLNSWGGTVGADMAAGKGLNLGLALTATYGDLRSQAAERATGDLDSVYLNAFAHYQNKGWGHTLVLTGTTTEAKVDRSVNYGVGSYKTHGSTDGYGVGALYELSYDIPVNDRGSMIQPLFDLSLTHSQLDGYHETGDSTANLAVGKQEWTTGTVALGARWSGTFGTQALGRTVFGELQAHIAQDFGDTQGKTAVGFVGIPNATQNVYGAKEGSTAFQLSAGISTAITSNSVIYVNGNAEVRNRANTVNGSVGLRISF